MPAAPATTPTLAANVPAIHVEGLAKSFGELAVLRGVDFDVPRGSIFALLGSNGAGKTTVVRILATLLRSDAGTTQVAGFDVATQPGQVRLPVRDGLVRAPPVAQGRRVVALPPGAACRSNGHRPDGRLRHRQCSG